MESKLISGYTFIGNHTSKKAKDDLSKETKKALLVVIDKFLLETSLDASRITLCSVMDESDSTVMQLFSHDIEGFLHYTVSQHVKSFFSTRLDRSIEYLFKTMVKSRENPNTKNTEPFNLRFGFKDGKTYWVNVKDKKDDSCEEYTINGNEIWALMTNTEYAKSEISKLINNSSNRYSVSSIINRTKERLLQEWRMQE